MSRIYVSPDFKTGEEVDEALNLALTAVQEAPKTGTQYARADGQWVPAGVGPAGQSAFEAAKELGYIPETATKAEFIESLAGKDMLQSLKDQKLIPGNWSLQNLLDSLKGRDGGALSTLNTFYYNTKAGTKTFSVTNELDIFNRVFNYDATVDTKEALLVTYNGVVLRPGETADTNKDWSIDAAGTITFTQPLEDDRVLTITKMQSTGLAVGGGGGAAGGVATGTGVQEPPVAEQQFKQYFIWNPNAGMEWEREPAAEFKPVRIVADQAARLALNYPTEVNDGSLIVQQDTGWTYEFRASDKINTPPAVTLRYGPTTPTATNPVNPIDFIFTGLPAAKETTFQNHSVLIDESTGTISFANFEFTIPAGGDINAAWRAIKTALPTARTLTIESPTTIRDILPADLKVMDAVIVAYSPPDPAAPITEANYRIFSDFITLGSIAERDALITNNAVREGMTVHIPSIGKIFYYQQGAWQEGFTRNNRPNILARLEYNPEEPLSDRLEWIDARTEMAIVEDEADLSDRTILPISHIAPGKLVFVRSNQTIYELVTEAGSMKNDITDWKPLVGGLIYVSRVGDLPDHTKVTINDGQMFVVKLDTAGEDLFRLYAWNEADTEWVVLNRHVWIKALAATDDQQTDQQAGDLSLTLEQDHKNIKAWDATNKVWVTLFDDTEINNRIAALSLFEGTVREVGGTAIGAVDLDKLPNLWALENANDLSKVSHYWVYVGQTGYIVQSAAQQKAEVVAAGAHSWGEVKVTTNPAGLPLAAGTPFEMVFEILDDQGAPGASIEVDKTLTIQVEVIKNAKHEFHEMRFNIITANGQAPMQAKDVANLVANTWVDGTIGLTINNADQNDNKVEVVPDADTAMQLFNTIDGGTPGIGEDLAGAVLNIGDWVQVANRGTPGNPDLHYVTIGGNLLTKERGDKLYSLQDWSDTAWEQGTLVNFQGGIFRAQTNVAVGDGDPSLGVPVVTGVTLKIPDTTNPEVWNLPIDVNFNPTPAVGDTINVAGANINIAGAGVPFDGTSTNVGDVFVYVGPTGTTSGTTDRLGIAIDHGWAYYPQGNANNPTADVPDSLTAAALPSPWQKVNLGSGGVQHVSDDAALPAVGRMGEVYLVLSSANAGGKQALYSYDTAAQRWQELGGSTAAQQTLNLTGGTELIGVGVPVGSITMFGGQAAPEGWLICDGTQFNNIIYPELEQVLGGTRLPDLRNVFVRGGTPEVGFTKHNWTTGMPRNPITVTIDNAGNHSHSAKGNNQGTVNWRGGGADDRVLLKAYESQTTSTAGDHSHTAHVHGGDTETVPDHVILNYIICARSTGIVERV